MKTHSDIGYDIIIQTIPERSRVLDLGCGDGKLLSMLQEQKKVKGFGVEISSEGVSRCVEKGLYCYQADIDEGLTDYKDNSFDFVILNQTLQSTKRPDFVVREILRIGKKTLISFPNFAHIHIRYQFFKRGSMPKSSIIPYEWYETPNIHMVTINDFRIFCEKKGYPIEQELHFNLSRANRTRKVSVIPNLFAQYGFFILDGSSFLSGKE